LAPLSVAALRLPEETIALLAAVGVSTIGQLMVLPRLALSSRFGSELLVHLDWATGEARELLLPHRAVPQVAVEWSFETPVDSLEVIEQVLEELIRRASAVLAKRDEGALAFVCRIDSGDGQRPLWPVSRRSHEDPDRRSPAPDETLPSHHGRIALAVGLFRPSASPKHLWELLKLKLQTLRLAAPVTSLAIEVTSASALSREQQELFTPDRSRDAPRHLSALVERLSSRLGREAAVRPVLMPDAQPEFASVDWPWTGERRGARDEGRRARGKQGGELHDLPSPLMGERSRVRDKNRVKRRAHSSTSSRTAPPGVRPIWLAETPLPLSVISVVPAGPPAQFHFDGVDYRVARSWGPERIETGWWRTAGARRDYYRVETTSGRRFWLFRRLADARWFLHGEFG
jgi:protein ImuB